MEPRKNEKREPKAPRVRQSPKPKLWIVKLEGRIAPASGCPGWVCGTSNHNETLVRESAKADPKTVEPRKAEQKPRRFRIVKLEERIAPSGLQKKYDDVAGTVISKL